MMLPRQGLARPAKRNRARLSPDPAPLQGVAVLRCRLPVTGRLTFTRRADDGVHRVHRDTADARLKLGVRVRREPPTRTNLDVRCREEDARRRLEVQAS